MDLNRDVSSNSIVIGDSTFHFHKWTDQPDKKFRKTEIIHTIVQMDIPHINRTCHPTAEYTFCSSVNGTSSRIDHIVDHKISLSKFKTIEQLNLKFKSIIFLRTQWNETGN